MGYQTIIVQQQDHVTKVSLNRPERKNAFNDVLMRELTAALRNIDADRTRLLVLTGEGQDFCAGADLSWMKQGQGASTDQYRESSLDLLKMYAAFRDLEVPLITRVFGRVFAGGVGLCAASDVVFADPTTTFCISETRVGLIPAVMAPFVIERTGLARFRELTLSARVFDTTEAGAYGLVDRVLPASDADAAFAREIDQIQSNGPDALRATKRLCRRLSSFHWDKLAPELVEQIAQRRASDEGQEGLAAFLEKRAPKWRTRQ